MPTPEQAQEILALLEGYEKTLSADRLPRRLFLNLLPAQFQSMEVQLPEWLEAAIFIWNPEDEDDYFNLILGTATSRSGTGTPTSPLTMRFPMASSSTRNWTPSCTWTSAWPNCETDPISLPPPAHPRRGGPSLPSYYNLATICHIPLLFLFISCILSVEAPAPRLPERRFPMQIARRICLPWWSFLLICAAAMAITALVVYEATTEPEPEAPGLLLLSARDRSAHLLHPRGLGIAAGLHRRGCPDHPPLPPRHPLPHHRSDGIARDRRPGPDSHPVPPAGRGASPSPSLRSFDNPQGRVHSLLLSGPAELDLGVGILSANNLGGQSRRGGHRHPPAHPRRGLFSPPSFDYNLATVFHFVLLFLWLSCILWIETPLPVPPGIGVFGGKVLPLRKEVPLMMVFLFLILSVLFTPSAGPGRHRRGP